MRGQPPEGYARFNHSLRLGRLAKLQDMQLATEVKTGIWHLPENMEATLRDLGMRGDIIKTMHAEMARSGRPTLSRNYEIFRPEDEQGKKIIGKLIGKDLSDELSDRYYLVVEGVDGKTHYADIGQTADIAFRQNQSSGLPSPVPNQQITALYCPPAGEKRCHTICTKGECGKIRQIKRLGEGAEAPDFHTQAPFRLKRGVSICQGWVFRKAPNEHRHRCQFGGSGNYFGVEFLDRPDQLTISPSVVICFSPFSVVYLE